MRTWLKDLVTHAYTIKNNNRRRVNGEGIAATPPQLTYVNKREIKKNIFCALIVFIPLNSRIFSNQHL